MNLDTTDNLTIQDNTQQIAIRPLLHQFKEYPVKPGEHVVLPQEKLKPEQTVPQARVITQPKPVPSIFPAFFIPAVAKFLLLIPAVFTTLYARSYTGEYQLFVNNQVTCIMYAVLGSLFLSLLLFWQKPWKSVILSMGIIGLLNLLHALRLSSAGAGMDHSLFNILFGRTFNPADFIYYGFGSALSLLILWLLHHNQPESRTEVY
jgi:hypothetical protein